MKSNSVTSIAAAAVLVLTAGACGGGGESGDDGEQGTMVIWADPERTEALRPFAKDFGSENGVRVEVQEVPRDDLQGDFVTAHEAGNGPDIVVGAHDWTGNLVQNGAIDPVPLPEDKAAGFEKTALEAVTFDGKLYGVPYATENLMLVRNTELAPDAPKDFEELVETGSSLKDDGDVKEILGMQVSQAGDPFHLHPFYVSAGGYLFGEDGKGGFDPEDLGIGTPESVEAFEKIAEFGEDGKGAFKRSIDGDNVTSLFTGGDTAYFVTGPWNLGAIKDAGVEYDISPIPGFADGAAARPFLGVQTFFVAAGGKNKVLGEEFVTNYVTGKDLAVALYEADPRPPALTSALEQVGKDNEDIAKMTEAGEDAVPMPSIPAMGEVWDPLGKAEASIIGGGDVDKAVKGAADTIDGKIG